MRISKKKYSASKSEMKLADAITYAMAKNQIKNYVNLRKFCEIGSSDLGKNPIWINFGKIELTPSIIKVIKTWKLLGYKCTNTRLMKGIDLLYSQIEGNSAV